MSNLETWCYNLKQYWINKDIDNIINLFDEYVEYYETPNMKIEGINNIKEMWEEIKGQNTSNIDYKILCESDNKIIANYILKDTISYNMVYEIVLNKDNKCIYFKQWYMEV